MDRSVVIGDRPCHIWQLGSSGPTVFWAFSRRDENILPEMDRQITAQLGQYGVQVIAFEVNDWLRDLSPWPADAPDGGYFPGKGDETLAWLAEEAIPYVQAHYTNYVNELYMAGYSLAGLFSLWALYEVNVLSGCACCSGSLWYQGWDEYMEVHHAPGGSLVYLSLGGKEPNTKNKIMSTIGEKTKQQDQRLEADPAVKKHIFEWNSGGHFANAEKRVVKGIRWLLENMHP
ncbi:MAG: alpha/beta hydrolase [Oscillospiraceae bacterium]|nr:alpha/beta hydrolase [Oscillospiraceae bacterium]